MAVVTAHQSTGLSAELTNGRATWVADEPPAAGGQDDGPDPYELLASSLAACTAMTLRLYANYKGIDLETVDVRVEFDRVHAEDSLKSGEDKGAGLVERLQTSVRLRGTFDEAQRKRLGQVASRCPVHRTLGRGVLLVDSISFE